MKARQKSLLTDGIVDEAPEGYWMRCTCDPSPEVCTLHNAEAEGPVTWLYGLPPLERAARRAWGESLERRQRQRELANAIAEASDSAREHGLQDERHAQHRKRVEDSGKGGRTKKGRISSPLSKLARKAIAQSDKAPASFLDDALRSKGLTYKPSSQKDALKKARRAMKGNT